MKTVSDILLTVQICCFLFQILLLINTIIEEREYRKNKKHRKL